MSNLNYTTFVTNLANMMPIGSTDANFITFVPTCIDYSEGRCYRELDLLATQQTDATTQVSSGDRNFMLPTSVGTFITCDSINLITPAGTVSSAGTRSQLSYVTPEFIDAVYPTGASFTGMPKFYGMRDDTSVVFGPAPDQAYYAEVIGIQRPLSLSSGNSSTPLTTYVPDLFFAAAMVFASAYMRNFGAQADDPRMAMSWETQYQTLFRSAEIEQARAEFQSQGWTSEQPTTVATPPRA